MPLRDLIKILLSLALLLGFPGIPTLLVQTATGPAPVEEREDRVSQRAAENVHDRSCAREDAPGPGLEDGLAPQLPIAGRPRALLPARDVTRLALGISTTRLRC